MTKTTMPSPVAVMWWEDESGGRQAPVRRLEVWPPFEPLERFDALITIDQAEAYAAAKVREALEEAYLTVRDLEKKLLAGSPHIGAPQAASFAANQILALIRALIPK